MSVKKSEALKELQGTNREDRKPFPIRRIDFKKTPVVPAWFGAEAKAVWKKLLPLVRAIETVDEVNLPLFEALCVVLGNIRRWEKVIHKEGDFQRTPTGFKRAHPAVAMVQKATREAALLAKDFGFQFKGRRALEIVPEPLSEENEFDLFLSNKKQWAARKAAIEKN